MADSFVLYGPGGASPLQLGTWAMRDPGVDFGTSDLEQAAISKNPWSEGALQLRSQKPRKLTLPLLIGSHADWGGMPGAESLLRRLAVPGAYIDIQPEGVASAEAVRFDILAGRWEPDYQADHQRVNRRRGRLELDVKTWGYWPTTMTLASVGSVALPGMVDVSGASIIGDAPPLLEINVQASTPTSYETFYGSYAHDVLAFAFAQTPSFRSFWPAASLAVVGGASLYGDVKAPGSQGLAVVGTSNNWIKLTNIDLTSALEPAYRGAHRVFGWAAFGPSQGEALQLAVDVANDALTANVPFPPAAPAAATIAPVFGSSTIAVPTGYQFVDLGVVDIPGSGSGNPQAVEIRLWGRVNNTVIAVASPLIQLAGLMLMPQPLSAYMPAGWHAPTIGGSWSTPARLTMDGINGEARLEAQTTTDLASHMPIAPAAAYRGPIALRGTPSLSQLHLVAAERKVGLDVGHVHDMTNEPVDRMWYHRFGASFFNPFAPIGVNTASYGATGVISGGSHNAVGPLDVGAFWNPGNAYAVSSQVFLGASDFALGVWARRATLIASLNVAIALGTSASHRGLSVGLGTQMFAYVHGNNTLNLGSGFASPVDASYHLLVVNYSRASLLLSMYYDGSYLGAFAASPFLAATTSLHIGRSASAGVHFWNGGLAEPFVWPGETLTQDRIYQMWQAGVSPTNTPSAPMTRMAEDYAAVSVRYRPQFAFLKGI